MFPIRTIVHATDFSDSARAALQVACSLARERGARLVILHVQPPPATTRAVAQAILDEGSYRDELRQGLHGLLAEGDAARAEYRVVTGEAAPEILRVAREGPCDVLVLGTHGRTGLRRLLLGSVAEQVVRHAPCPVVTVRPTSFHGAPETEAPQAAV
jgi:nucleotide-binding universal stress UspA family protein